MIFFALEHTPPAFAVAETATCALLDENTKRTNAKNVIVFERIYRLTSN